MRFLAVAGLAIAALCACGVPSRSMISYAGARSTHAARFHARGEVLVVRSEDPMGATLVVYDPTLVGDRIVLTAGIASGGGERVRARCLDLGALAGARWEERLAWREPDGSLVPILDVERGEGAGCDPR